MAEAKSLKRQCLGDQIRTSLMKRIISGELEPGQRLIELAIAKEFGTSQTPVREALHDLEGMHMVEAVPHKGVRVRSISEQEMAEAYTMRGLLEEFAGPLAARHFGGKVKPLLGLAKKIEFAAFENNTTDYAEYDFQLHRQIVEASGNGTLLRLWDSLAFEFRTPLQIQRRTPDLTAASAEHFQVISALEIGDGVLAGELLRRHCESFVP